MSPEKKKKVKASTSKKAKKKRASCRGRLTKYNETFPLRAQDYARRGLTNIQTAKKLGISEDTFYEYQKLFPEFSEAIKRGKQPVDVEVENALLKRALGFEYEEVLTEYELVKIEEENKGKTAVPVKVKKTKKMVVPDTTACIFWSKNRRPDLWRDKHDLAVSGGATFTIVSAVPRSKKKGNKRK